MWFRPITAGPPTAWGAKEQGGVAHVVADVRALSHHGRGRAPQQERHDATVAPAGGGGAVGPGAVLAVVRPGHAARPGAGRRRRTAGGWLTLSAARPPGCLAPWSSRFA